MYNYIIGKVTEIESNYIVLDNNGIEYYTLNPYSFTQNNEYKFLLLK